MFFFCFQKKIFAENFIQENMFHNFPWLNIYTDSPRITEKEREADTSQSFLNHYLHDSDCLTSLSNILETLYRDSLYTMITCLSR